MKTINATVTVEHHDDGTVTYAVWFESGLAVEGTREPLKKAANDIGSAFLLEADD